MAPVIIGKIAHISHCNLFSSLVAHSWPGIMALDFAQTFSPKLPNRARPCLLRVSVLEFVRDACIIMRRIIRVALAFYFLPLLPAFLRRPISLCRNILTEAPKEYARLRPAICPRMRLQLLVDSLRVARAGCCARRLCDYVRNRA